MAAGRGCQGMPADKVTTTPEKRIKSGLEWEGVNRAGFVRLLPAACGYKPSANEAECRKHGALGLGVFTW